MNILVEILFSLWLILTFLLGCTINMNLTRINNLLEKCYRYGGDEDPVSKLKKEVGIRDVTED